MVEDSADLGLIPITPVRVVVEQFTSTAAKENDDED
jgi:hypothetical protein